VTCLRTPRPSTGPTTPPRLPPPTGRDACGSSGPPTRRRRRRRQRRPGRPASGRRRRGRSEATREAVVRMLSKLVHCASWLAAILTVAATAYWVAVVAAGNYCWSAFAFTLGMALPLGSGILLFGVIPSAGLYLRARQRRDWI